MAYGLVSGADERAVSAAHREMGGWVESLDALVGNQADADQMGSCNRDKGLVWINLDLDLDLAKKPLPALDYVILHEIAHFVSPYHDTVFVSVLDRNMPDWRQIRADLNALPLSFPVIHPELNLRSLI